MIGAFLSTFTTERVLRASTRNVAWKQSPASCECRSSPSTMGTAISPVAIQPHRTGVQQRPGLRRPGRGSPQVHGDGFLLRRPRCLEQSLLAGIDLQQLLGWRVSANHPFGADLADSLRHLATGRSPPRRSHSVVPAEVTAPGIAITPRRSPGLPVLASSRLIGMPTGIRPW